MSGPNLFEISAPTTDVFAVKLDNNGNVVYSTYFGGSGNDAAAALAVGSDGSLYVTGSTNSADLPVTAGAYLSKLPSTHGRAASFVFKLNPDGSLDWATYFTESGVASIAVDSAGNPYIGGCTGGGLPTTPGAYQTTFQQSVTSNGFFGVIGPTLGVRDQVQRQGHRSDLLHLCPHRQSEEHRGGGAGAGGGRGRQCLDRRGSSTRASFPRPAPARAWWS